MTQRRYKIHHQTRGFHSGQMPGAGVFVSYGYNIVLMSAVLQHLIGAMIIMSCVRKAIHLCPFLAEVRQFEKDKEQPITRLEGGGSGKYVTSQQQQGEYSFPHLFATQQIQTLGVGRSHL